MSRGTLLLSHEFDGGGRIVGNDVPLYGPPEIALQADEGTVDRGRFLSLSCLQIGPIPRQSWSSDSLRCKAVVDMRFSFGFVPGNEVAQVAQVIANGCR